MTEQLEEARKGKDRFQAENAEYASRVAVRQEMHFSLQNQIAELTIRGKQLEAAAESKERAWQDSQREAGMRNEVMGNLLLWKNVHKINYICRRQYENAEEIFSQIRIYTPELS